MKRFLIKILIFALIIGTVIFSVNSVYMMRDHSDPQYIAKFKDMPDSIKVCNFGSSHGLLSFNYEDVKDVTCFNFALTSQFPSYDKRLLDNYIDKIEDGAVVFITVSYFSFYGPSDTTLVDFEEKNKRYYEILPPQMVKEYDLKTDLYVKLPSLTAGTDLFKVLFTGNNESGQTDWTLTMTDADVQKDAENTVVRHILYYRRGENKDRYINDEELESIEYMIEACQKKGCTPILITTPYLKEYTDEVKKQDPGFFDDFYSHIRKIVNKTGVKYYDYAFDERFNNRYDLFMTCDHLNKDGARIFVNTIMDEIVHYGTDDSLI